MKSSLNAVLAVILLMVMIAAPGSAQTDTAKAPVYGWKHSIVGSLTLTQVAFSDWSQGGENALAWALGLDGKSTNEQARSIWDNSYKFGFGQARLGDQGIRKTDDRIDLESMMTFKIGGLINPYVAATLKTQFATGYKYDGTGKGTAVSQFFDPGYMTQSAGMAYKPSDIITTRLGAGLREIITSQYPGYADDPGTAEIEKTQVNGGLESVTELTLKIDENVGFSSKLELFATFKHLDQIILRSDNTLSAKVSKYITVMMNVQFLNERTISPRTQVKETIAMGLSYSFL
jgi:hypothetical protein